ncbi:hypothetical protein KC340_g12650 [Hortaea werneckii]|nr:hypothetical protein KC342_g12942 [Hortaea werneckii]KAI7102612.1 hypothetical protein KC339_g5862 [Hortaea werneckii]KAI7225413.1 hypothetical protein KC365_g10003 [Hortaea werneckii]KAI7302788.1 hypothetical protein KC340_g12650 [Hortaea werneckii]KAI7390228.1 hypothetical protein KC328_g8058 [Hortaea werneckii]
MGPNGSDAAVKGGHHETKPPVHRTNGPQTMGTSSLDALQSQDSRRVMDIVDKLRRSGLSGIVQLPQLVVSGDQSSGKSSVLEAITEIPFPRKENLCTRFATEIILRRAPQVAISTKIIPDKVRPAAEKKRLEGFKRTIVDFSELPDLMEEATNLMGLGGVDDGAGGPARAFSRDVLSIEIAGPGRPHLTLVDLPGLIHSENKMQSKEDVELIRGLVDDYLKEKRTIIMAVVSAKNDYANQIILKKCRDVDPKGHRTIGIITKPDFLEPGSENEASWLELAENKDIFFELGWHMLKNRSDKESDKSFEERNAAEKSFFSQGSYRDLSQDILGIVALRTRLSQLLYKHLKTELPALQKELNDKHRDVCRELEQLGEKRSTPQEQRRFLMGISTTYQDIVKAAVNGQYEHEFFGDLDPDADIGDKSSMRRLRAVAQHFNLQFASAIRQYGHKLAIIEPDPKVAAEEPQLEAGYEHFADFQEHIEPSEAVNRLFWEQSSNWQAIAAYHIENVASICWNLVENALASRLEAAKAELGRIIADMKHHPITYDPAYTAIVQRTRQEKHNAKFKKLVHDAETDVLPAHNKHQYERYLKPDVMKNGMDSLLEPDMDRTSAEDALDCQQAYYNEEVKYFISAITKQVIERYLLRDLANDTLSPMLVGEMSDDEVSLIAAEAEEITRMRSNLEARKSTLENGQQTFRSALGLFK